MHHEEYPNTAQGLECTRGTLKSQERSVFYKAQRFESFLLYPIKPPTEQNV